jgi:hypothetical protein
LFSKILNAQVYQTPSNNTYQLFRDFDKLSHLNYEGFWILNIFGFWTFDMVTLAN